VITRPFSDQDDAEPKIIGYRLTLTIVGPYHRDDVVIEDDDLFGLKPLYVTHGGDDYFERYGHDGEFVEYREDHVVARRLEAVYEDPPAVPFMIDPETIERAAIEMPTEERLRSPA